MLDSAPILAQARERVRRQNGGAVGFVVSTVSHPAKIAVLARLAAGHRILVAVDEAANAAALSTAATAAGATLGVLVEVDTGMDRCGTDTAEQTLALARRVMDLPGLRFEGITGYEGHCSLTVNNALRHERQRAAMMFFTGVADLLEADGIHCGIRSAGGIATWRWMAMEPSSTSGPSSRAVPGITGSPGSPGRGSDAASRVTGSSRWAQDRSRDRCPAPGRT